MGLRSPWEDYKKQTNIHKYENVTNNHMMYSKNIARYKTNVPWCPLVQL